MVVLFKYRTKKYAGYEHGRFFFFCSPPSQTGSYRVRHSNGLFGEVFLAAKTQRMLHATRPLYSNAQPSLCVHPANPFIGFPLMTYQPHETIQTTACFRWWHVWRGGEKKSPRGERRRRGGRPPLGPARVDSGKCGAVSSKFFNLERELV